MMSNSNPFTPSITERLLKRSARKPPAMENRMNGSANRAPMDSPKWFYSTAVKEVPNRAMKITRFLTTLSLNAP